MTSCSFPGGLTTVDYAAFLSRHDVVYLAPPTEGIDGLPVGNGELGAMIWAPADRLQLQINKVGLWDDRPNGSFTSWATKRSARLSDQPERQRSATACQPTIGST